ncbi:MAG: phosphoribosylformylglycinamidine cyclo-ligase [Candidatus Omnitrophica bacterium]|nr:phosphoribosylformylglycinamidine cyclo-ligase [Candidatus Omnitrophota bacterium]MCM8831645.1 phosphoribosylformylglycinamidine cyclo-ligase [Candidatus Omnitrophota bacterium]
MENTYKKAGVDIDKLNIFKQKLKNICKESYTREVLKDLGSFGSLFAFDKNRYKNPVLVSSTDGVGTKLKIAQLVNKHNTIGIDLVAMNVNDILCLGAEPLFFLDYISYAKLTQQTLISILKGINKGCVIAGCSLIGGETAQMPDIYKEGEYDLAGFCVGVVNKDNIIDGRNIKENDLAIGIASSGLHSNGFSLVRKVLSKKEIRQHINQLLKPTQIYVKPILKLLYNYQHIDREAIKGIAHISGGAFYKKAIKILPSEYGIVINKKSWSVPKIFKIIQEKGNINEKEMYTVFNMGIGMILVVESKFAKAIIAKLASFGLKSWIIGQIIKSSKKIEII